MKKKLKKKKVSARVKLLSKKKKRTVLMPPLSEKPEETYRIMAECKRRNADGHIVDYYYVPYMPGVGKKRIQHGISLDFAESLCASLKRNGQGGQLIRLDGSPQGQLVEQWPSLTKAVDMAEYENRMLAAMKN